MRLYNRGIGDLNRVDWCNLLKNLERLSATNTRRLVNPVICRMKSTLLNVCSALKLYIILFLLFIKARSERTKWTTLSVRSFCAVRTSQVKWHFGWVWFCRVVHNLIVIFIQSAIIILKDFDSTSIYHTPLVMKKVAFVITVERNNRRRVFGAGWSTVSYIRWQDSEGTRNPAEVWRRRWWDCAHGSEESQTGMHYSDSINISKNAGKISAVPCSYGYG